MSAKRGKAKRRNRSKSDSSTISQHKRIGKKLLPPMLHMLPQGKMSLYSWINNRLPEVLWAALAANAIPREDLLQAFWRIAAELSKSAHAKGNAREFDLTHSALDVFPDSIELLCTILLEHPAGLLALRPLLLFDGLPARDRWASALNSEPTEADGVALAATIGECLDHQSQKSTDIRWLTLMFKIGVGKAQFPEDMINNLSRYLDLTPEHDDMRFIRPSIRAAEMAFRMVSLDEGELESAWCNSFWKDCLEQSECIPLKRQRDGSQSLVVDEESLQKSWFEKQYGLVVRFSQFQATTGVDARFDAVFGIALFAGNLLLEVMHGSNRIGISGRLLLRALAECRITLAYLIARDDALLWTRFRQFGIGQAKLALLKFDDALVPPKYLSEESLGIIANEDASEEFVAVDLGHWCDVDLRKMAEFAHVKNDYDAYYGWSSAFVHGSWAAIRDSSLTTCLNPLHRWHRVPSGIQRHLEDVLEDAVSLFNSICADVDKVFTGTSEEMVLHRTQGATPRE